MAFRKSLCHAYSSFISFLSFCNSVLCLLSARLLVIFAMLVCSFCCSSVSWRLMNSPLPFLSARRLMNLVSTGVHKSCLCAYLKIHESMSVWLPANVRLVCLLSICLPIIAALQNKSIFLVSSLSSRKFPPNVEGRPRDHRGSFVITLSS